MLEVRSSATAADPCVSAGANGVTRVRLLNEWFTAFNAEDYKAIHAWGAAHMPGKPDLGDEGFRAMTGGFVIKRIKAISPTSAEAIVQEQKSDQFARAQLDVDPKDPDHIVEFHIRHGRPPDELLTPEQRASRTMDAAKRAAVVDAIAQALVRAYVKADNAKSMAAAIRAHLANGGYDKLTDAEDFAQRLTDDLHADTRDLHMRVLFGRHAKTEPPPLPEAERLEKLHAINFGFGKIARLPGNIAHVVIDGFPTANFEAAQQGIGERMSQAADADALILNLRDTAAATPKPSRSSRATYSTTSPFASMTSTSARRTGRRVRGPSRSFPASGSAARSRCSS